jgi:hypothetical protein
MVLHKNILHKNIYFCEVFVVLMMFKDIFHSRNRIVSSMNACVKLVDVVSGLNGTILLRSNKARHARFSIIDGKAKSK